MPPCRITEVKSHAVNCNQVTSSDRIPFGIPGILYLNLVNWSRNTIPCKTNLISSSFNRFRIAHTAIRQNRDGAEQIASKVLAQGPCSVTSPSRLEPALSLLRPEHSIQSVTVPHSLLRSGRQLLCNRKDDHRRPPPPSRPGTGITPHVAMAEFSVPSLHRLL